MRNLSVYVVLHSIPYEGSDIIGIFETQEAATIAIESLIEDTEYIQRDEESWVDQWDTSYSIETWEVQKCFT